MDELKRNDDGEYVIRIEIMQWEIQSFDQVGIDQLMNNGFTEDTAKAEVLQTEQIGNFIPGSVVNFIIVSRDVQHGFSIPELGVSVAVSRITPGEDFGAEVNTTVILPNEDTILRVECDIFCGLDHPDVNIELVIGSAGSTNSTMSESLVKISLLFIPIVLSLVFILIIKSVKIKIRISTEL